MPIHPNVPEAFIAAYAHFNQPKETSEPGLLATAAYAIAGKMTPQAKIQSCQRIIALFKPELKAEDWIELTYTLGDYARINQIDKKQTGPSRLSAALHAARSYIVACLQTNEYEIIYTTTLSTLNEELKNKDTLIAANRRLPTVDVSDLCTQREKLLTKLAYLGDENALDHCIDFGYFNYMPRHNEKSVNTPVFMYKNYYVTHYDNELRDKIKIDLNAFLQQASERDLPFALTQHAKPQQINLNLVPPPAQKAKPQAAPVATTTETAPAVFVMAVDPAQAPTDLVPQPDEAPESTETLPTADEVAVFNEEEEVEVVRAPSPIPSVTGPMGSFPAAPTKAQQPDPKKPQPAKRKKK